MATFSNLRANFGLVSTGAHTKSRVANDAEVGVPATTLALTGATKCYVISATLATVADTLTIDTETGVATIGTAPVPQVETATAAGTITLTGNATVVVTGARVAGSPVTLSVPVVNADTAATWAGKVRSALNANAAITAAYTVGGTSTSITLTETVAQNNDGTLNISLANGTCTGITTAATSANTTAGVGGVKLTNNTGDGKDFEGVSLGSMNDLHGLLVKVTSGACGVAYDAALAIDEMLIGHVFQLVGPATVLGSGSMVITALTPATEVEITIFAQ
jgi:hypothetical protein